MSDANTPAPLGSTTTQAHISHSEATYLPPSSNAIKYAKGIHAYSTGIPHPSHTKAVNGKGGYPHLIKSIESFYVRPRWLFVRVSPTGSPSGDRYGQC